MIVKAGAKIIGNCVTQNLILEEGAELDCSLNIYPSKEAFDAIVKKALDRIDPPQPIRAVA